MTAGTTDPTTKQEQLPACEEATEVAPGVVRVQLPIALPGLGHVNCYVIEDPDGLTLVDPGLPGPESAAELDRRLRGAGFPPERVHTVVVTHSHPDHFGGAGRLAAEHRCGVAAHERFATPFERPDAVPHGDLDELVDVTEPDPRRATTLREVLFGHGDLPEIPPRTTPWGGEGYRPSAEELAHMRSWDRLSKEGLLTLTPTDRWHDGQHVRVGRGEWTVLHTPGHTDDHICLLDEEHGTLLSGDHVLPTITPHISGMVPGADTLAQFFDALARIAAVPGVRTVLPAHGLPFDDVATRVDEIVAHHRHRLDLLADISAELDGGRVVDHSRRLFRERSWGPMAESETYAHLEHLRLLGRLAAERGDDGQLRYRPTDAEPDTAGR